VQSRDGVEAVSGPRPKSGATLSFNLRASRADEERL
jgi:hypothetical protein